MLSMPKLTIIHGVLLVLLGSGSYIASGGASKTALIPAIFGFVFLVCGMLGLKENLRKHVMHAAAAVALLAILAILSRWLRAGFPAELNLASGSQILFLLLTVGYMALSIKSFIDARRRRQAGEIAGSK
jgi:hypothetical protein